MVWEPLQRRWRASARRSNSLALHPNPQRFLLRQRVRRQRPSLGSRDRLHGTKPALELRVRPTQRTRNIHLRMTRKIGRDEQHVTDLVGEPLFIGAIFKLVPHLFDFLDDLVEHWPMIGPVEADVRGTLLQFHRTLPFGQSMRDTGERARVFTALRRTLFSLQPIPVARLRREVFVLYIFEDVRMP